MPKVTKLIIASPKSSKLKKGSRIKKDYTLPSEPSVPAENLIDYSFLIYGRKKIGKTSLVSRFNNALFFMFEPGTKAQSVYQVPDTGCFVDWKDVKGFAKALQKQKTEFVTACFDPGNKAYDLCLKYVCEKNGISHPGKQKDYGASWKAVSNEFEDIHLHLANAGLAFVVIAHEKYDEDRGVIFPKFSPSTEDFYEGVIDNIFYYHFVGTKRFLQIRGTEEIVAGTRCESHFMTASGKPVYKIPMGNSADESYRNLQIAWDNKQEFSYGPDEEKEVKVKKVKPKIKIGLSKK